MNKYLDISPEVRKALDEGRPVVALESTIISHGMPYPRNVETALMVEQTIRDNGGQYTLIAVGVRGTGTSSSSNSPSLKPTISGESFISPAMDVELLTAPKRYSPSNTSPSAVMRIR